MNSTAPETMDPVDASTAHARPAPRETLIFTTISARVIQAFGPIIQSARSRAYDRFYDGSFWVFPAEEGALCLATDGVVLAAYQDRRGQASEAAQFSIPDVAITACRPPSPFRLCYPGDYDEVDVPEWMQPDRVYLSSGGLFVTPKMHRPGDDPAFGHSLISIIAESGNVFRDEDYRCRPPRFDPRGILARLDGSPAAFRANPFRIGLLSEAAAVFGPNGNFVWSTNGEIGLQMLIEGCPDFIALVQRTKGEDALRRPAFVGALQAELGTA